MTSAMPSKTAAALRTKLRTKFACTPIVTSGSPASSAPPRIAARIRTDDAVRGSVVNNELACEFSIATDRYPHQNRRRGPRLGDEHCAIIDPSHSSASSPWSRDCCLCAKAEVPAAEVMGCQSWTSHSIRLLAMVSKRG
eukprot:Amastigsp_a174380_19.p5 type:complete len:139 gc:universal Amastigsp_a174380_19:2764-2348(-)